MIRAFIMWMVRRTSWTMRHPMTSHGREGRPAQKLAWRYHWLRQDEIQDGLNNIRFPLPWWMPCNALLHQWLAHDDGGDMHDHPRWSITICLKGEISERTPWAERVLRPGCIVFRRASTIHGFRVKPEHSARTWTLFIVGRRRAVQNSYQVRRNTKRGCDDSRQS